MPPLILTLTLDAASQAFFDGERRRWFPPARNMIPAHITLFHRLPDDDVLRVLSVLSLLCADARPSPFWVEGVKFLGRGVAYSLQSAEMVGLRARLAALWRDSLTPQDRQGWRPHVTIQNKVEPVAARALHSALSLSFVPFGGTVAGLAVWRYLGEPWESAGSLLFSG